MPASPLPARLVVLNPVPADVVLLRRLVELGGLGTMTGFTEPRDALLHCLADPTDVLLLDLHVPGLDAYAFMAALRDQLPDGILVPVIALTTDATNAARDRALSGGAKDFLIKPLDAGEVVLRVRNQIQTAQLYRTVHRHNGYLRRVLDERLAAERGAAQARRAKAARIEAVLAGGGPAMVFQPILATATNELLGVEALARFSAEPVRPPNEWLRRPPRRAWARSWSCGPYGRRSGTWRGCRRRCSWRSTSPPGPWPAPSSRSCWRPTRAGSSSSSPSTCRSATTRARCWAWSGCGRWACGSPWTTRAAGTPGSRCWCAWRRTSSSSTATSSPASPATRAGGRWPPRSSRSPATSAPCCWRRGSRTPWSSTCCGAWGSRGGRATTWAGRARCRSRPRAGRWTSAPVASSRAGEFSPARFIRQVVDLTERELFERQLRRLADHDALTALYTWRRFAGELLRVLAAALPDTDLPPGRPPNRPNPL